MQILPTHLIDGHHGPIQATAFAPDGARFVAGDRAGALIVYERQDVNHDVQFTPIGQIRVPAANAYVKPEVRAVAWSPDGSFIATHEYGAIHTRNPQDLSEIAVAKNVGTGPIAFGQGGAWLAALGETSLMILSCPNLERVVTHFFYSRGGFEYFKVRVMAVDPHGTLIAVGDDGGQNETAMGAVLERGEPQVTLLDLAQDKINVAGAIGRGAQAHQIAFDQWRGFIFTATFDNQLNVWAASGELIQRFAPYPEHYVNAFTVTERWIVTVPYAVRGAATIDLWDATTFEHHASAPIPGGFAPGWITASPDGLTLLTPDFGSSGGFGIRVWSIV